MEPLVIVHVVAAVALLVVALVVGGWGIARAPAIGAAGSGREGRWYAQLLQLSHTLVLAVGVLGVVVLLDGNRPDDPLHTRVYGPFMLVAIIAAYGYRTRDAALNVRVFAIASLVVAALAMRAIATGA
ncbi:MAG: hypothetical protein JWM86_1659 [Thermoleophilia bacterium]|nr:hypothetical protein [Thermoleophilia bacterium]